MSQSLVLMNVTLVDKDSEGMIKLRVLRWGYSELSGWILIAIKCL